MEIVIDGLFIILGSSFARWVVAQFSPSFIGNIFEHTRKIWKKATFTIKRENL